MKKHQHRKCSALLAAGAGAAVCLTGGGGAHAAGVSGNIFDSNGKTSFNLGNFLKACTSQASWTLRTPTGAFGFSWSTGGQGILNHAGSYIYPHDAGVMVSAGMVNGFADIMKIPNGVSDKYFAVKYQNLGGGVYYGWLHVNSTTANTISLDKWGYENTPNAPIHTLAGSISAKKLGLADGRTKLLWSNANEDGVARYEVQAKDASGAWNAVSSEAPGAGMYSIAVPKGAQCRVVVEKVDGTTVEIGF